jgi:hypothetical protein
MFQIALRNPKTTIAGLVGFLSLAGGILATYQGGSWWPVVIGVFIKGGADAVAHALAADAAAASSSPAQAAAPSSAASSASQE